MPPGANPASPTPTPRRGDQQGGESSDHAVAIVKTLQMRAIRPIIFFTAPDIDELATGMLNRATPKKKIVLTAPTWASVRPDRASSAAVRRT